jgi:ureidoglycolate lyase
MKVLRYGPAGAERPALLAGDGTLRDLSEHCPDITASGLSADLLGSLRTVDAMALPVVEGRPRLGPPVANPGNLLCIGMNYRDHASEAGMALPAEPLVFSKHTSALAGPNDPVPLPRGAKRLDWEVELAVVIGRETYGVREQDALSHVAGYCVCNDVSERTFQLARGGQWIKGKSSPGFCPLGPVLVTTDEIPDPQALRMWLTVNGEPRQEGSTADMVFSVAHVVSALSTFMRLLPGDIIATGTPAGVGMGRGVYLKRGDIMEMGIDGIGTISQTVV